MSGTLPVALLGALDAAEVSRIHSLFEQYVCLVSKWNRSIQLLATSDPVEIHERHLLDSLAVVPHVEPGSRVLDVGAGGGFPGIVVAIARPGVQVTSLEPIHKKLAFLSTARRELKLGNFLPLGERDDVHCARDDFKPYDVAISRATFAIPEWLERGLALVRPGGIVVAMEGREQHALPPDTVRHPYPLADRQRALLIRRRTGG